MAYYVNMYEIDIIGYCIESINISNIQIYSYQIYRIDQNDIILGNGQ